MKIIKTLVPLGLLIPAFCLAAVFSVSITTDLIDANPGDGVCEADAGIGNCSLRAAIMETNALAGSDTINLPAGVFLLSLTGDDDIALVGDLDINTSELIITGDGMDTTFVDGNSIDRIFSVSSSNLTLQDLTIRNGSGNSTSALGGGLFIDGAISELLLQRVRFSNNSTNAGGGLYAGSSATVRIEDSVFIENTTVNLGITNQLGPAIYCNTCNLSINRSTITQNRQGLKAINVINGTIEVLNSTISDNDFGGIRTQNSNGIIKFSTFVNNGWQNLSHFSFDDSHVIQVGNSVLQTSTSTDCDLAPGDLPVSLGYNVTSDTSCAFTMPSDLQSTDANLGSLQDNGGLTNTHLPASSSVLLNQVPVALCTDNQSIALPEDQRGESRPSGTNCDIGSVERNNDIIFANGFE